LGTETFELILVGDKQYIRESDSESSFAIYSSGSRLNKEDTLRILDSLTGIVKLSDEVMAGVDCLHLRGEVDQKSSGKS
jgi:uncharacterized protein YxjI